MREIVFALEFRGRAGPEPGAPHLRRARSTAPSPGLRAVLDSRVERFPDGSFVEDGTITYGSAGAISFVTIGRGHVGPSPRAGWAQGAVIWEVTGGDGRFAGARGLVTSSFTVGPDGDVIDHHVARLYIQDLP